MKNLFIFSILFFSVFTQGATDDLVTETNDNVVNLGVPENEQLNYIRKLALYHFRKAQWN